MNRKAQRKLKLRIEQFSSKQEQLTIDEIRDIIRPEKLAKTKDFEPETWSNEPKNDFASCWLDFGYETYNVKKHLEQNVIVFVKPNKLNKLIRSIKQLRLRDIFHATIRTIPIWLVIYIIGIIGYDLAYPSSKIYGEASYSESISLIEWSDEQNEAICKSFEFSQTNEVVGFHLTYDGGTPFTLHFDNIGGQYGEVILMADGNYDEQPTFFPFSASGELTIMLYSSVYIEVTEDTFSNIIHSGSIDSSIHLTGEKPIIEWYPDPSKNNVRVFTIYEDNSRDGSYKMFLEDRDANFAQKYADGVPELVYKRQFASTGSLKRIGEVTDQYSFTIEEYHELSDYFVVERAGEQGSVTLSVDTSTRLNNENALYSCTTSLVSVDDRENQYRTCFHGASEQPSDYTLTVSGAPNRNGYTVSIYPLGSFLEGDDLSESILQTTDAPYAFMHISPEGAKENTGHIAFSNPLVITYSGNSISMNIENLDSLHTFSGSIPNSSASRWQLIESSMNWHSSDVKSFQIDNGRITIERAGVSNTINPITSRVEIHGLDIIGFEVNKSADSSMVRTVITGEVVDVVFEGKSIVPSYFDWIKAHGIWSILPILIPLLLTLTKNLFQPRKKKPV